MDVQVSHGQITQIQDYQIRRVLSSGKAATLYEAVQESSGQPVALKLFHDTETDPSLLRRFFLEADLLLKLQHPGIAKLHKTGMFRVDDATRFYHVMELIDGRPLLQYADENALDLRRRLQMLVKICGIVHYLHQNHVLHRNLKPENIWVEKSGQPRVIDLGMARIMSDDQHFTAPGQIVGNLTYMSPEQVIGKPEEYDERMDVYALGGIGYTLLTRRPPFTFKGRSLIQAFETIRNVPPEPLSSIHPGYAGEIERIIAKALAKQKSDRYPSVEAFAEDIMAYMKSENG